VKLFSTVHSRLLGRQKAEAEASAERLDVKIRETRAATRRMVEQSYREINKAHQVLQVAEAALKSIRKAEQHQ